ncbi:MAG: MBL fold metallo-hydrolase [Kiloniella sp.]|nr:MBL fold metallo-hydrolase [Kiloniella sp.]
MARNEGQLRMFETQSFDNGVTRLLETGIAADWRCNIWHIRGRDRDLIIDTGFGLQSMSGTVARLSERPVIAVCTHSHHDHAGGLCQFDQRLGHGLEADIFAKPTRENTVCDLLDATVIRAEPSRDFDINTWCYQPAPLTGTIDEGDVIDLGDRQFQVLHLPGHSPGSVALWEAATGTVFTGDALYDGILYDHLYHSVPEQMMESLNRICDMPLSVVHAGHFSSFGPDRAKTIKAEYLSGKRSMLCPR